MAITAAICNSFKQELLAMTPHAAADVYKIALFTSTATPTVVMQAPGDMIRELASLHGLTVPLVNASGTRSAGTISQTISLTDGVVTVQRV
jgi:hypothetical protein